MISDVEKGSTIEKTKQVYQNLEITADHVEREKIEAHKNKGSEDFETNGDCLKIDGEFLGSLIVCLFVFGIFVWLLSLSFPKSS
ncbi:Oidioi.mRNA.OKI2018_I69.chr2.g3952.t1.cds [Oikopleura dioica]|uniref:Oidioi.mRNA.OKI2018_I69.chr2.g3952.t1.cds n=1 Tax=Oikopleura dioica TaxID=34765 RepID=A0ABN7SZM9_OIKDI|nr:Oidioi.mRNA.OKI2018_I69.chr2.g3952.t1.cds [Oikopleura dioica]